MVAPYQAIQCADGYVTIGASTDRLFGRLCDALEHPEWASMPEFAENPSRVRNRDALAERIESVTRHRPKREWLEAFDARDIPCGPINNYADVFGDAQIVAREMVVDITHPTLGRTRALGSPIKLSATPAMARRRAPQLGEHSEQVLREAGFMDTQIAELLAKIT
jgi:formyl-CoA transferase